MSMGITPIPVPVTLLDAIYAISFGINERYAGSVPIKNVDKRI